MSDVNKEIKETIIEFDPKLREILGDNYQTRPFQQTLQHGFERARSIMNSLNNFSKSSTFPEYYNTTVINSLFALSFLYISPFYKRVAYSIRFNNIKRNNADTVEEIKYFVGVFSHYIELSKNMECAARLLDLDDFNKIKEHVYSEKSKPFCVYFEIDLSNPTDNILKEMKDQIDSLKNYCNKIFGATDPTKNPFWSPPPKSRLEQSYWPIWHQAFECYCLKLSGVSTEERILRVFKHKKNTHEYSTGKTTEASRRKVAESLIEAAVLRKHLPSSYKTE